MDPELRELLDALLDVNRLQSEQVRDLAECVKILDRRLTTLEDTGNGATPIRRARDVEAWFPESRKA